MTTVTRPLFGDSATGSIGKLLTFSVWRGRSYVRALGTFRDQKTAGQIAFRNTMRTIQRGIEWANHTATIWPGQTQTDKARISALAQPAYPWHSFLIQTAIGEELDTYNAMLELWETFTGGEKTAWDAAAAALEPPMLGAPQFAAGGIPAEPLTPGNVYLAYRYGLYALNLSGIPNGDPSNWGPPPEPSMQTMTTAPATSYDWDIPTTAETEIPGMTITKTTLAEWVHVTANGEFYNVGTAPVTITCRMYSPSMFGETLVGPPCDFTLPAGQYAHFDLDFCFLNTAGEITFHVMACADVYGGQLYQTHAIMAVHTLGF